MHLIVTDSVAMLLGAAAVVLLILAAFWIIKRRRDIRQAETGRLLRVAEESNRILREDIDEARSGKAELVATLEALRKAYVCTYKEKFAVLGELCDAYLASQGRTDKADYLYRRVERLIAYISDDRLHGRFEEQIDRDLNDIVRHLKADLGIVDKRESRFICYCIVGFDPQMIGTMLGMSLSNVYSKKSRLKKKIRELDSPYKEYYLRRL